MRKASRLFAIIQTLRLAPGPVTAAAMGESLGVTQRSIYRDIGALQAMRVPIEGGRGIGYILRPGFTLPPLMFSVEEIEAIVLALALLDRTGDDGLKQAAKQVNQKIAASMPQPLRQALRATNLHAWGSVALSPDGIDLALVRSAIRDEQKLRISYRDQTDRETARTIQPVALIYYSENTNIIAWCELRQTIRQFRAGRITHGALIDAYFHGQGDGHRKLWMEGWRGALPPPPRKH